MSHMARLIARIEKWSIPEPTSGCWLWLGAPATTGYGRLRWRGRQEGAHRWSWRAFRGPVPGGMYVLHRCDNRLCVNPDHLFLGSHLDNIADRHAKGRSALCGRRGRDHSQAKLSDAQVKKLRRRVRAGECTRKLASEYGISRGYVYSLKLGWGRPYVS